MTAAPDTAPRSRIGRWALGAGSVGLLGIMLIDATAVVGRHIGVPLLGSIELAEALIVVMASASLVGTTLERGHASVHILTERLGERARTALRRVTDLTSALFFALISLGSIWIALELWGGDEQSELLGLPLAPLRIVFYTSTLGLTVVFATQASRREPS